MLNEKSRSPALLLLSLVLMVGGAGTEAKGQGPTKSPLVVAIEDARPSVVAIRLINSTPSKKNTVGTGVIIHPSGYMITNRHVIGPYKVVNVRLYDGKEYPAQLIETDPSLDLALLQIQGNGTTFQPLALEPVEHLWVGEEVLAIGHPYGYTFTVSRGIVSAVGRELTMPTGEVLNGLIQTDAAINPGNSGGPLINTSGQLIGINVALRDGAQGIAFAINVASVRGFVAKHVDLQSQVQKQNKAPAPQTDAGTPQTPQKSGQENKSAKSKRTNAEDQVSTASPAHNEETSSSPPAQSSVPVNPVSNHQNVLPLVAEGNREGSVLSADFSTRSLIVALIGLLLVVICQQYLILRRNEARPPLAIRH